MLLVLGIPGTVVAAPTRTASVEPALHTTLAADGTATFWVYLRDRADLSGAARITDRAAQGRFVYERLTGTARASQAGLVAMLKAAGASHQPYWIANTVRVTGDAALLKRIAARPEVTQIATDQIYQIPTPEAADEESQITAVEWNISRVNAPQVWQQHAVTGEDIVIGSIDTGVRYNHPALVKQYRGNLGNGTFDHNYNWWDPSSVCGAPSLVPCDNNNHGTHTVGTMVGNDGGANQIGVAPGAKWMAAKGCESNSCTSSALLSSGQFMLAPTDLRGKNPNPALRPHIINNSWGGGATTSPWYQPTVQAWVAAGIFPQFSSGNPGSTCGQAGNPGNLPEAYSAGAFDVNGALYVNSGRGPSAWGADQVKPNIAAPGVAVRSSFANGSYGALTGTSMASPHVAGVVALLWSAAPALERDIAATRSILDGSAMDTADLTCGGTSGNNNVWGQGKLDALAAVTQAPRPAKGQLTGTVLAAPTNTPIAGATITIAGSVNRTRTTGPDGRYAITLPAGSYTVTASAFGYQATSGAATVVEGGTAARDFALAPPDGRQLSVAPRSLDFGVTKIGDTAGPLTATLTGTGAEPVTVSAITESGVGFAQSGGTCGALPVTLSHLESCTVAYTFTPTVEEPATAPVTVTSDAVDGPHAITLEGIAIRVPLRVDAVTLAAGENVLFSGLVDPAGRYAYFGTQTSPGRVVKVDLSTFQRVGAITLAEGENNLNSAVIDPAGRYAYLGTGTAPGRIVKIDLATFQRVGTITLDSGENYLRSAVIDPAGAYAYFGTGTAPGRVVKIDLNTFQRVDAATLSSGVDNLRSAVIDPAGGYAYFGTGTAPGLVVKLDLTTFAEVGVIAMVSESLFYSAVIDPVGRYAYFGTGTSPGRIVKIDLAGFQRVEAIELATGENSLLTAAIDPAGRYAYFGTGTAPGGVVKIELAGFQRVGAATLAGGENSLLSAVIDPQGGFVYLGTLSSPGRVVKVKVDTAIQLSAAAHRVRGNAVVNLAWDGATSTDVDVFRDGTRVATVPNNGTYADAVDGSGAVTYTYRVCHAGTLKCSNKITVRFAGQQG
ncbi:S8 family serine peptidase [Micromonospora sp. NPDC047620]|uniref:S8 family serine peptidase n=1 Tax=Micromonospora sp. NPDC047620 TaxID=3364251 RepID=UPI00371525EE